MNSSPPITQFGESTINKWNRLTGRKKDALREDLVGLILEQSIEAQVTMDTNHRGKPDYEQPTVAEIRACSSIDSAQGKPPFLVPDLTVRIDHLTDEELEAWNSILDLYEAIPSGWVLVGGQMVHLHHWQRQVQPPRVTTDADLLMDIRINRDSLRKVSAYLQDQGFEEAGRSPENIGHRWIRSGVKIDLLIPEGLGERSSSVTTVTGARTVQVPGGSQEIIRAQSISVQLPDRIGHVIRPSLLGALVGKAAALEISSDPRRERHLTDFASLAKLIPDPLGMRSLVSKKDRRRVSRMVWSLDQTPHIWGDDSTGLAARGTAVATFDLPG